MQETLFGSSLKRASYIALLVLIISLFISLQVTAQETEKKKLTLRNIMGAGILQQSPTLYKWLPEGKGFIYRERGAFRTYDIATGENQKLFSPREITSGLMKDRKARDRAVLGNTNASGRFNRGALVCSSDGTLFLGSHDNDIYIYNSVTKESKFLTDDPEPEIFQVFSPDSTKIAYVKDDDIYVMTLADEVETRLTDNSNNEEIWNGVPDWVYEEELTVRRAFWWSPDSSKIAYLQFDTTPIDTFYIIDHMQVKPEPELQKFPLAGQANSIVKLGVVDMNAKTTWVDTGEDTDVYIFEVKWTKSGKEFSYHWMNRDQNRLELRFANPETGASRAAIVDESDTWINASGATLTPFTNLRFLKDDSFVWGSERSGFRHIYYYDNKGSAPVQLTSGDWQVDDIVGISADGETVYFTGRKESPIEKHFYSVGIDGTGLTKIFLEKGTHNTNVSPDGKYFFAQHSSQASPPRTRLYSSDGKIIKVLKESDISRLKEFDFNYSTIATIEAEDGETLYTALTLPPGFDESKKYPVIVYTYGGPGVQLITDSWSYVTLMLHQIYAAEGYIVWTLDNRGSYGRGLAFESKLYRNMGDWEIRDQITGVKYLRTLPYVDPDRIGITGGSYGGYMTLLALFKAPEFFQVGVAESPGTDWHHYDTIYTERYMDRPQDNPEGYKSSAVAKYASNLKGKLYITHGIMDNNAHFQHAMQVIDALIMAQKDFKLMIYPQERHGIRNPMRRMHNMNSVAAFFREHLLEK